MSNTRTTAMLNGAMCRHAFNDSVEALSRLASYSTSRLDSKIGDGEYTTVSQELCRKDLIILSISLRRLAELTSKQEELKARSIKILQISSAKEAERRTDNCWNLIGNIIHGSDIEIWKSKGIIEYRLGIQTDMFKAIMQRDEVDAVGIISSVKHGTKMMNLVDFCIQLNQAIENINDFMGDNGVFLGAGFDNI